MGVDGVSLETVGPEVYGQDVSAPQPPAPDLPSGDEVDSGKFTVRLHNFTGPFDLLLQLIGKHKMDVTEVALHQVTDDFIAYIRAMGDDWDLDETSEFLLVAATLLDLKAARLLPAAEVEDEEDLALLEARDLLFSRLLQYKAFKEAAAHLSELESQGARRWPRAVTMEPRYAEALPDLVLGVVPQRLFKLALKQFMPKPGPPQVSIAHIHQVRVSVREHANLIRDRLRRAGSATFSLLIADCDTTLEVVARFLALLELYREGLIEFEQPLSLDELTVRWVGGENAEGDLEIDDYEGSPPPPDTEELPADADLGPAPPLADDTDPDDLDDLDLDDVDLGGSAGLDARVEAALSAGFDDIAEPRDADLDRAAVPDDDAAELGDAAEPGRDTEVSAMEERQ
jgi:segregation and condensation protein A